MKNPKTPSKNPKNFVIVTGGSGFIGSALLRYLVPKYPYTMFINVDDLRAGSNEEALKGVEDAPNYIFQKVAIENPAEVQKVFKSMPISDVIHLAAESDVDRSLKMPIVTAFTNINGTINLLEATKERMKRSPFNRFVYVSTDEVYGQVSKLGKPKVETDLFNPSSPYSASKSAAEGFVQAYRKTYGIDAVITRGANTFGAWQNFTKFIPVAVKALAEGRKIPIYGDGLQMREWLPVGMHCEGIEAAWLKGRDGEAYNISTGVSYKNIDLAKLLIKAVGASKDSYEFVKDRPGHDFRYTINSKKIMKLGWPKDGKISKAEIAGLLMETAHWYYSNCIKNDIIKT